MCIAAIGFGMLLTEESCKPTAAIATKTNNEKISVALSQFENKNTLIVKNSSLEYDILLVKKTATEYTALQMRCTHRGADLKLKDDKLSCPAHGSVFDFDGQVLESPASSPLTKFPVELKGNQIIINLKKS